MKGENVIERAEIATKEIINEFEETLETTNQIIYTAAYVITEKLNGKRKNYMRKKNELLAALEIKD